jgi:S1-C subfamily serine protease
LSWLDVILVVLAVAAAVGGYRLGFVTRVLSWIGLGLGLVIAVRLAPPLLDRMAGTRPAVTLAVVVCLLVVGASLGQALGFLIGGRLRPRRTDGVGGRVDGGFGALAGLAGLVAVVWLLLPVLAVGPTWIARPVTTSLAARTIDEHLPPAPDAMEALRDLVGDDPFPDVFDALRATPDLGPPPPGSGLSAATSDEVARSVVKVEGTACDRIQDGSGWVVAPGRVVTNAHVVAGETETEVVRDDGRRLDATLVAFDPDRDLAVLDVDDLDRPALPVTNEVAPAGTIGGVFGHPGGEPLRIAPFEVARPLQATGRDIYDDVTTRRDVLELAAALRPGDSGSALVDPGGRVVGVAFAIARDRSEVAYALATTELAAVLEAAAAGTEVSAGACLG